MHIKNKITDLAIFGGEKMFTSTKSTSNLVQPDFNTFLQYSKVFFDQHQYTNNGPLVKLLEQRLADFHNCRYCVTFCSGFWGIVLAMSLLAIKGKNEIIMPSLSYRRMADIAAWAGLVPRFCEVDKNTLAVNAEMVAICINNQTALILGLHPIINCCDVEGLVKLASDRNIPLLFDSVESAYESCATGKIGCFGDAECFSLHASKLINGFEGGYITTNNRDLAYKLSIQRGFGFYGPDNIAIPGGLNAKLNEIHAAMALANLDQINSQVINNKNRYIQYKNGLVSLPALRLLEFDENYKTSYKNIVVELLHGWPLTRDETVIILNAENVLSRAYYSPPLHQKRMQYPHIPAKLEQTDFLSKRYMLLPCGEFVDRTDIESIIALLEFLQTNGSIIKNRMGQAG